jgi:hypothetical protein
MRDMKKERGSQTKREKYFAWRMATEAWPEAGFADRH